MVNVLGVDGARAGWVGVLWDGATPRAVFDTGLGALCDQAATLAGADLATVAVDMPIELTHGEARRCDDEARPLLGPRRSSLFSPPAPAALDFEDYASANAWSKATLGRGISKQAWMLVPKIREVRELAALGQLPLYETFPELAFRAMNGDEPLSHPKRTWTGMASRLQLLRAAGIDLPVDVGPAGSVAADDLIDAGALAWSAMRIALGHAERVPADCPAGQPSIWW